MIVGADEAVRPSRTATRPCSRSCPSSRTPGSCPRSSWPRRRVGPSSRCTREVYQFERTLYREGFIVRFDWSRWEPEAFRVLPRPVPARDRGLRGAPAAPDVPHPEEHNLRGAPRGHAPRGAGPGDPAEARRARGRALRRSGRSSADDPVLSIPAAGLCVTARPLRLRARGGFRRRRACSPTCRSGRGSFGSGPRRPDRPGGDHGDAAADPAGRVLPRLLDDPDRRLEGRLDWFAGLPVPDDEPPQGQFAAISVVFRASGLSDRSTRSQIPSPRMQVPVLGAEPRRVAQPDPLPLDPIGPFEIRDQARRLGPVEPDPRAGAVAEGRRAVGPAPAKGWNVSPTDTAPPRATRSHSPSTSQTIRCRMSGTPPPRYTGRS